MASYDVIEHVYDISLFFNKLRLLSDNHLSIFFASAANKKNPFISRKMRKLHRQFEKEDRPFRFGKKPTDTIKALEALQTELIDNNSSGLSVDKKHELARLTRGQKIEGILSAVDFYKKTGFFPSSIGHPTNTCDPYTGNWFERLMEPSALIFLLNECGFNGRVISGYYDQPANFFRSLIKFALNFFIRLSGQKGLILAPYYCLAVSNFSRKNPV